MRILQQGTHQLPDSHVRRVVLLNYFFVPNRILSHLEDAELNHGFGGNFDLLLPLLRKCGLRPWPLKILIKKQQKPIALFIDDALIFIAKCLSASSG